MNRLRQLKKSDWIAIALTGVLILIIAGQPECICGCDGKEAEAGAWADGGGRGDRGDDHAVRLR